jgi:rSAM/selenodomain-associated transferase 2
MASISIIIPTYNEAANISKLINYLLENGEGKIAELIISDGGSTDLTVELAVKAGAKTVLSPQKGRAAQMNHGATIATGDIFYFIHADTFPPTSYVKDILNAIQKEYDFGRYRTRFDSSRMILKLNAWFTRFDLFICYGGDQTLFIRRSLFERINGFDAQMRIMEDYDIVTRAKATGGKYKIFAKTALLSARKYDTNSWLRVQTANYTIIQMFKRGASQEAMATRYKQLLNYR